MTGAVAADNIGCYCLLFLLMLPVIACYCRRGCRLLMVATVAADDVGHQWPLLLFAYAS